jgi:hypothetical protein
MPEHLGKLEFYLEALDRDVRKPHEHASIGVLLCASKDNEVVEYALSRSLSAALIAEYQTRLPDRKLLQTKLHQFYELTESAAHSSLDRQVSPIDGNHKQPPRAKRSHSDHRAPKSERRRQRGR